MHRVFSSAIYLLALLATTSAADRNISITVQAGDFARRQSVVTFALPEGMKTGHALRRGGKLASQNPRYCERQQRRDLDQSAGTSVRLSLRRCLHSFPVRTNP